MITFLPYPDFKQSAECLDWQYAHNRLNNQINEGIIILKSNLGLYEAKNGIVPWSNHPAVTMWKGHEFCLLEYISLCNDVWEAKKKQYSDPDRWDTIHELYQKARDAKCSADDPSWLGNLAFHSAHRSILLAKMPSWYWQFGWAEKPAVKNEKGKWPYVWPTMEVKVEQK
jgi:hypothetical protein